MNKATSDFLISSTPVEVKHLFCCQDIVETSIGTILWNHQSFQCTRGLDWVLVFTDLTDFFK